MKIIFASSAINESGGGIASYAIDFIKEYGFENEFLVISNDQPENKYAQLIPSFIKFSSYPLNYKRTVSLLKIIEDFKPDIIINSDYPLLSIAIPYLDPNILKISISHFVDGKLALIAGFNHKYYNSIVALSNEGAKSLKRYYPRLNFNKVKVIYNFYRPSIKKITNDTKKQSRTHTIKIVFPGGSGLHKSPSLVFNILLGLIKLNSKFKFYWLGDTLLPGARLFGKKYIRDFISPDTRIVFTSKVNREEAVNIIQDADIFLLPSKREGCPITLLEAMSVGTIPIVSNAKHASSELITHNVNGFILSSTRAEEYIQLIYSILRQPLAFQYIKTNSLDVFNMNLSPKIWKDRMDQILHEHSIKQAQIKVKYFYMTFSVYVLKFRLFGERIKMIFRSAFSLLLFHYYKMRNQYKKSM